MPPVPQQKQSFSERGFEALKLIAFVAMFVDHAVKILFPMQALPAHVIGRLALPLFAFVIVVRIAHAPDRASRYLPRLILWGGLAQVALFLMGEWTLNIMFTFASGIALQLIWDRARSRQILPLAAASFATGLLLACCFFVDYGIVGALLIPLGVRAYRSYGSAAAALFITTLCFVTQLPGTSDFVLLSFLGCFSAVPLMLYSQDRMLWMSAITLPRYSFYLLYAAQFWCLLALMQLF